MDSEISVPGFESLVGKMFKSESCGVVCGSLFSIGNPEGNVAESVEDTDLGSNCWFCVVHGCFYLVNLKLKIDIVLFESAAL